MFFGDRRTTGEHRSGWTEMACIIQDFISAIGKQSTFHDITMIPRAQKLKSLSQPPGRLLNEKGSLHTPKLISGRRNKVEGGGEKQRQACQGTRCKRIKRVRPTRLTAIQGEHGLRWSHSSIRHLDCREPDFSCRKHDHETHVRRPRCREVTVEKKMSASRPLHYCRVISCMKVVGVACWVKT
jgi:hypothetical protein